MIHFEFNGEGVLIVRGPSPSSSVSALFPRPSPSVSIDSAGLFGKASCSSGTPSPSSSESALSPTPSESVSMVSRESREGIL